MTPLCVGTVSREVCAFPAFLGNRDTTLTVNVKPVTVADLVLPALLITSDPNSLFFC